MKLMKRSLRCVPIAALEMSDFFWPMALVSHHRPEGGQTQLGPTMFNVYGWVPRKKPFATSSEIYCEVLKLLIRTGKRH